MYKIWRSRRRAGIVRAKETRNENRVKLMLWEQVNQRAGDCMK
jgi:hypothetical protein